MVVGECMYNGFQLSPLTIIGQLRLLQLEVTFGPRWFALDMILVQVSWYS